MSEEPKVGVMVVVIIHRVPVGQSFTIFVLTLSSVDYGPGARVRGVGRGSKPPLYDSTTAGGAVLPGRSSAEGPRRPEGACTPVSKMSGSRPTTFNCIRIGSLAAH